jgi:hypothetical protein
MLYSKFLQHFLAGSFAIHSSRINNHKIIETHTISPKYKIYKCIKSDSFIEKFGLDIWIHEEKINIINDSYAEITDILKWELNTSAFAKRTYIISKDNNNIKRDIKEQWKVEYTGTYLFDNFIAEKMKKTMILTDLEAFDSFCENYENL